MTDERKAWAWSCPRSWMVRWKGMGNGEMFAWFQASRRVGGAPDEGEEVVAAGDYDRLIAACEVLSRDVQRLTRENRQLREAQAWRHAASVPESRLRHDRGGGMTPAEARALADAVGRLGILNQLRVEITAALYALADEVEDWRADVREAADERCDDDQLHCSCVGVLRNGIRRAEKERDEARAEVEQLRATLDKIADRAAIRKSKVPTSDYAALVHIEDLARRALDGEA